MLPWLCLDRSARDVVAAMVHICVYRTPNTTMERASKLRVRTLGTARSDAGGEDGDPDRSEFSMAGVFRNDDTYQDSDPDQPETLTATRVAARTSPKPVTAATFHLQDGGIPWSGGLGPGNPRSCICICVYASDVYMFDVYIYICTYIYTYVCVYVNVFARLNLYAYMYIYIYIYICMHVYMCMHLSRGPAASQPGGDSSLEVRA